MVGLRIDLALIETQVIVSTGSLLHLSNVEYTVNFPENEIDQLKVLSVILKLIPGLLMPHLPRWQLLALEDFDSRDNILVELARFAEMSPKTAVDLLVKILNRIK